MLSEFSDCVDIFKKEQVEKIHNQKILIVAGFFATEAFFAFFSKKTFFVLTFDVWKHFLNGFVRTQSENSDSSPIVAIWSFCHRKPTENSDNNQKTRTITPTIRKLRKQIEHSDTEQGNKQTTIRNYENSLATTKNFPQ